MIATDPAADLTAEITVCLDDLRPHLPKPNPDFYPEGEDAGQICKWALEGITEHIDEWAQRTALLADAVEQLHNAAHGGTALLMCAEPPCRGLYRALPNAQGRVLTA